MLKNTKIIVIVSEKYSSNEIEVNNVYILTLYIIDSPGHMSLKTNILRIKAEGSCNYHRCHFNSTVTDQDAL